MMRKIWYNEAWEEYIDWQTNVPHIMEISKIYHI